MKSSKKSWPVIRTFLFLILGLMNTAWAKAEDLGSWKNYLGYLFLLLFVIDATVLVYQQLKSCYHE